MPRQLIYASAPAGLAPGRSGYCTVAKSPGLRDRLARELELLSAHEPGEGEAFTFNLAAIAGETFAVITRFDDAGPDYTGRASTLAHHLVFDSGEIAGLPPPADLARRFTGWIRRWEGQPRELPEIDAGTFSGAPVTLPAATWKKLSGDAGKAALFCEENGRAKPGTLPDTGDTATLALIAEAALLLEDKGWTTPFTTRRREPDPWAVWRVAARVSPAALPDPGRTRLATLARSGVTAGIRPGGAPNADAVRKAYPGTHDKAAGLPAGKNRTLLALAVGTTLAALALIAFVLARGRAPETDSPAPVVTPPPAPVPAPRAVDPLVTAALAAVSDGDWPRAAQGWLALQTSAPADAEANTGAILIPIRDRLVPESLARLGKTFATAGGPITGDDALGIRKTMMNLRGLATATGAPVTPADLKTLAAFGATLDLMGAADRQVPECTVIFPHWTKLSETGLAVTESAEIGGAPELEKFLSKPHAKLRLDVRSFDGFGVESKTGESLDLPPANYAPGRVLSIVHPKYRQLLELAFDARRRLTVTRRTPFAAPAGLRLLQNAATRRLSLTDTATGESHAIVAPEVPPGRSAADFMAPAGALVEKAGVVTVAPWLAGLVARVHVAGAKSALLPFGYNGDPRDYPGLETPAAIVGQALRVRLAKTSGAPKETAGLQSLLAGLPANLTASGAPWTIVIAPPASPPLTLIRFHTP